MPTEPLLDGNDIQGNILPGFVRQERYLVGFSTNDGPRLQDALAIVLPALTSMVAALAHRDERKLAYLAGEAPPRKKDLWLNIALGPRAIDALGANGVADLDDDGLSFANGMLPGDTGDSFAPALPDGSPNPASRTNWHVGSPARPLDLLLDFAYDLDVEAAAAPIVNSVAMALGGPPSYREVGRLLPGEIEHFGFRDGVSQVGVRGKIVQDGVERLVTTRYGAPERHGIEFGKPGQALVWPGQFLTGQPSFEGEEVELPPELTNGSFLVFRRLSQNVKAFYEDTDSLARQLQGSSGVPLDGARTRALIVGRFPSGAALMRHDQPPPQDDDIHSVNYFAFADALPEIALTNGTIVTKAMADPDPLRGRQCPVWAHIRKVNPRDLATNQGGPIETVGFQMLRRGIPFGPLYDHSDSNSAVNSEERGLLFLAYQRNIQKQFGILNRDWMNNRDAPGAGGFDLLIGQHVPNETGLHAPKGATFFGPPSAPSMSGTDFQVARQWVLPTGGAFLFAPSISFVKKYAAPPPS